MGTFIKPSDLAASLPDVDATRLDEVIADAEAFAKVKAPGIKTEAFQSDADKMAVVKAVLRSAIVYHVETADGRVQTQTAGPFSQTNDTRSPRSSVILSPAQIDTLRELTRGTVAVSGVYTVSLGSPDTLARGL